MFSDNGRTEHPDVGSAVYWLVQSSAAHPALAEGIPPRGLLSKSEWVRFATMKTEKRRRDWLLGRWTAKQLLHPLVSSCWESIPALDELTIVNNANGVPYLMMSGFPAPPFHLSISHSNGHAFCAATARGIIGADIERIEARIESFAEDYFTAGELARLRLARDDVRNVMVTAIWSAKEAVLKALHLGLSVDTRAVSCIIDPVGEAPQQWTPFAVQLDGRRLNCHALPLTGWWQTLDEYVLTLVTLEMADNQ